MLTISEDNQFLQTHIRKINQTLTSVSQSLFDFINQLKTSLPPLNNLQTLISNISSIDSQHLSILITTLLTEYIDPQNQGNENTGDSHQERILSIIHKLLLLPHDRQQLIKSLKDQSQKISKSIESKKTTKSNKKIDAQFVLLLCWLFGKKEQNIFLVELIVDVFAFPLIIEKRSGRSSQVLENWKHYIENIDLGKKMKLKISGRIESSQIISSRSNGNFPTHIYIPL